MMPPWQVFTIGLGRDGEVAERKMILEDNAARRVVGAVVEKHHDED